MPIGRVFKAAELALRKTKIEAMERNKKERLAADHVAGRAIAILEKNPPIGSLRGQDLRTLLSYHGIMRSKQGKNVPQLREKYTEIKKKNIEPLRYEKWLASDEAALEHLKRTDDIDLMDTALGRRQQNLEIETREMVRKMTPEKKQAFIDKLMAVSQEEPAPSEEI
eukprot:CAMPEP_0116135074 /NCGR_PEP_ID=MMETSP0329-20121206/10996_1 /TAXON_ID=697910 /ORGANISM="Pseudo-nitzschia arenysensis, Strain B593" /LENGTH=166 /DNA_ID=CAMNT_0003629849 /DNA_START=54 /DNA_END=554 /DNA_ORIENTATION=+